MISIHLGGLLSVAMAATPCAPLGADVVASWTFDETSGDVLDSAGTFDGVPNGGTRNAIGFRGGSFTFDGNDWVQFSDPVMPIGAKSMCAWLKTDQPFSTNDNVVLDNHDGSPVSGTRFWHSAGRMVASEEDTATGLSAVLGTTQPLETVNDDVWHHVCYTWDGTTAAGGMRLWLDGAQVDSSTANALQTSQGTYDLRMGRHAGGFTSASFLVGELDEVAVFAGDIGSSGVSDLYGMGDGPSVESVCEDVPDTDFDGILDDVDNCPYVRGTIVANWDFDEASGDVLDPVGGFDGVVNGGTRVASGIRGNAMVFDGDDFVQFADPVLPVGAMSICAWAISNSPLDGLDDVIVDNHDGSPVAGGKFYTSGGRVFGSQVDPATGLSQTVGSSMPANTVNDGAWHHHCYTWDGTTNAEGMKIYVDGVVEDTRTANATAVSTGTFDLRMGRHAGGTTSASFFDGTLDEVSVFAGDIGFDGVQALYAMDGADLACGDEDWDGERDAVDNCPTIANPAQTDANNDGYGDACVAVTAGIHPTATLGHGVVIGDGSTVRFGATVGDDTVIGAGVKVKRDSTVGAGSELSDGAIVGRGATVGEDVSVGENARVKRDASVGANSEVGADSIVKNGATVGAGAVIGVGAIVGQGSESGTGLALGDNSWIKSDAMLGDDVTIGNDSEIGHDVVIGDGTSIGDRTIVKRQSIIGQTCDIGDDVLIKVGTTVPDNTTILDGSTVP